MMAFLDKIAKSLLAPASLVRTEEFALKMGESTNALVLMVSQERTARMIRAQHLLVKMTLLVHTMAQK